MRKQESADCQSARRMPSCPTLPALVCALMSVFLVSCEPWGKPKPEPPPSDQITDFKTLYGDNCAGCHGVDGKNGAGRPLNNPLYLAVIPRETLRQTIEQGRPGTAMPAWARSQGGPLTDRQVNALVDGMESNWAKAVNLHGASLPPYSAGSQTSDASRGKKLFLRNCYVCHAQGGPVGPVTSASYLELVSDQMLRTSIIVGRDDLGSVKMPDFRYLNAGHALSEQDLADLVGYLSSLRGGGVK
jgi:mono/diheme cytochrome c family protein